MTQPRITYNSVNVDIDVMLEDFSPEIYQEKEINRAYYNIETITLFGQHEINLTAYFNSDVYRQLFAWWSWARQGKTFSFAIDSGLTGNTTLDGSAAADQKTIPLTSTTGFTAGDYCLIKADDNDDEFEIIEIASVSAGESVTAVDNLIFSYSSGDIFRHWRYWPTLVCVDTYFKPTPVGINNYQQRLKFVEVES